MTKRVVTGTGKRRVLIGKCGWKVPFFDSVCYVSLENIPLSINVGAIAKGNINVVLNGTAVVKVDNTEDAVLAAAKRIREIEKSKEIEKQNAELEMFKAEAVEKRLIAEIEKPADAERKKVEIQATAAANAAIIEAEAKAKAMKIAAQAEAEAIRLKGEAEAASIQAKAIAEAKGIEEKAKAFERYNEAAKLDLLAPVITEIGRASAESLKGIDKVTIVDGGDGGNVNGYANNTFKQIASSMEVIRELTGVDPKEMLEKDYKKNLNLNVNGLDKPEEKIEEVVAEVISEME